MMAKQKSKKSTEKKPAAKLSDKYRIISIRPGKYNFQGFGEIDLRTLSLAEADALVKKGFPFLVPKKKEE